MVNLFINPEQKFFSKYVRLAERNDFYIELDISLLRSNLHLLKFKHLGVHGNNKLNFNELVKELDFLNRLNISYVVYHDNFLKQFKNSLRSLKDYNFVILLENCTVKYPYEFNRLYVDLKKELKFLRKCIDTGHVNISGDKNLKNWVDRNVNVIHINNNFGRDSHNSVYSGEIKFQKISNVLKKSKYISLEVNKSYETYLKNIEYMIKESITPFDKVKVALNHPLIQKKFIREVRSLLGKLFGDSLCCSFIYGSFARKELNAKSDVDLMVILESKNIEKGSFLNDYIKLCNNYHIELDPEYPFEIFLKNDLEKCIAMRSGKVCRKNSEDMQELLFSFLDNNVFVSGNKRGYLKYRRLIVQNILKVDNISNKYNKLELKEIVRKYVFDRQHCIKNS